MNKTAEDVAQAILDTEHPYFKTIGGMFKHMNINVESFKKLMSIHIAVHVAQETATLTEEIKARKQTYEDNKQEIECLKANLIKAMDLLIRARKLLDEGYFSNHPLFDEIDAFIADMDTSALEAKP